VKAAKAVIDWTKVDARLRQVYAAGRRGGLKVLAIDTGISNRVLSARAKALQLPALSIKGAAFSPDETQFIIDHYPAPQRKLQQMLIAAGFPSRPRTSINTHLSDLRRVGRIQEKGEALMDRDCYHIGQVAELLGFHRSTVTMWVNRGLLKAACAIPPGDHHLAMIAVSRRSLRDFMKAYPGHWDCKRCDHYWLVDMLVGERTPQILRQESCGAGDTGEHALRIAA